MEARTFRTSSQVCRGIGEDEVLLGDKELAFFHFLSIQGTDCDKSSRGIGRTSSTTAVVEGTGRKPVKPASREEQRTASLNFFRGK
jgi:hypothetical protein